MSSSVDICNMALARLRASRITSLTDNTVEAKLCNILFDEIARDVMSEGEWTSTIVRATLARTVNTPAFEYTYEFQLPTSPEVLRVLSINDYTPGSIDYRIEGDKLLANVSTMKIKYSGVITNTEAYDANLKKAITSRLTAELAYPITGSERMAELLYRRYLSDLEKSLALNGMNGSNDVIASPDLTTDIR